MIRHQSNQSNKKKFEQNQLLSTKNANLRINTVLRNRSQTKSISKRKLLVYKEDDKFYIDNSAAYALNLTNVRAIMTEKPHLVELGKEELHRFQNDENIEIEYKEINKKKENEVEKYNLIEILEELQQVEYGIGIHGIDKGSNEEKQTIASNISREGLNVNNNSKTILSTSISLGTNEDIQQVSQEIMKYKMGNGTKVNAVIAVPIYIQNKNGEKIFLGFPNKNKRTVGQQYEEHCILDRICAKLGKIPSEFILGYYKENPDGSESFIKNTQHYSNIAEKDREELFKELFSNMDDISKNYNDLITSGNIEQLNQIKERMQQLRLNSYMVDNAMTLAQKYKGQEMTKNIKKRNVREIILDNNQETENMRIGQQSEKSSIQKRKNVRRIILDSNQRTENLTDSTRGRKIRKILLDACAETKLSDIITAKETLKEGIKHQERIYEGKEV